MLVLLMNCDAYCGPAVEMMNLGPMYVYVVLGLLWLLYTRAD